MPNAWHRAVRGLLIALIVAAQIIGVAQAARQELNGAVAENPYQIPCEKNAIDKKAEKIKAAATTGFWLWRPVKGALEFLNTPGDLTAYISFCHVIKNASDALGQFACFLFDTFVDPIFSPRQPTCPTGDPYLIVPDSATETSSSGDGEAGTPEETGGTSPTPTQVPAQPGRMR